VVSATDVPNGDRILVNTNCVTLRYSLAHANS
jgi:hypothetical protein